MERRVNSKRDSIHKRRGFVLRLERELIDWITAQKGNKSYNLYFTELLKNIKEEKKS